MNTVIEQLAVEAAEAVVSEPSDLSLQTEDEDGNTIVVPANFIEKFAELIVRECISVPYDMWDKSELNADVAVQIEHRFKEHFGIE